MRISTKRRASTAATYVERVNLAIDLVVRRLDEPLRLRDLAGAAMLSPFHFHRVFQVLVDETPADFVKRLRLEKALGLMSGPRRESLTAIALRCGFASSSDFSRSFRQRYGVAPSAFDVRAWRAARRAELEALVEQQTGRRGRRRGTGGRAASGTRRDDGTGGRAAGGTLLDLPVDPHVRRLPPRGNAGGFRVRIRDLPARTVAFIRVDRPYRPDAVLKATQRLIAWAERCSLADGQWLGYQWDNPEITSLDDCRYYIAVEAERFEPRGEIGRFRFPPMVVAQVEIRGGIDLELRALQWLYGTWLPRSGYVPEDHPGFESFHGRPFAHGVEYFELDILLPVKRE